MEKENSQIFTQSQEDDTESLLRRARNLINGGSNRKLLKEITPNKTVNVASKNSNVKIKPESVKDTRRLIRKEWDALKNSTLPDDDIPRQNISKTNQKEILCGIVAYIEVPNKQRIDILTSILKKLGASVRNKFDREVTHVVFKNGSLETYKRAKLLNVHLVSVLWVEACRNSKAKISEKLFPVCEKNDYSYSPRMFRKFMSNKQGHFKYDEITGTISRRLQNAESNFQNLNESRIETTTSGDSSNAESSVESITLCLSAEGSANTSGQLECNDPLSNKNEKYNSETKSAHPTKRRLFVKNPIRGSFLTLASDSSLSSQIEKKAILSNPYGTKKNKSETRKEPENHHSIHHNIVPETSCNLKLFPTTHQTFKKSPVKNMNTHKTKLSSLVTTYLHSEENKSVRDVIRKLGCFKWKLTVDKMTTHVIVGNCQRTLNLLKGIARGCWILDKQWVFESASVGHWLAEEYYELIDFSKIVRRCRIQRQALGRAFSLDIFDECGAIHISDENVPYHMDLKELVTLCGGSLAAEISDAKIVVGSAVDVSKECVSPEWIFDSITFGRCKTMSKYHL